MADAPPREGLRKLKRRETRYWIAKAGLNLILQQGFEATTVDTIAAAAGISRRTFFHYFEAKEDILLAWQEESVMSCVRRCWSDPVTRYSRTPSTMLSSASAAVLSQKTR